MKKMKLLFLMVAFALIAVSAASQDTLYVNKNNGISVAISVESIDSLTFNKPEGLRMQLHADTIVDTLYREVQKIVYDTLFTNIPDSLFLAQKLVTIGDELTLYGGWQKALVTNAAVVWSQEETETGVGGYPAMAVPGSKVMPDSESSIYLRALQACKYKPDVILLYAGENDNYVGDFSKGEIDSVRLGNVNERPFVTQVPVATDTVSFCAAYMGMVEQLIVSNPLARLFIVAQMPVYINPAQHNVSHYEQVRLAKVALLEQIASKYHLPLINLWSGSGVGDNNAFIMYDHDSETDIQILPNNYGSRRVAETILSAWKSYCIDNSVNHWVEDNVITYNKDVEELMKTLSASYYDAENDTVIDRFTLLHCSDIHGYLPAAKRIVDYCATYPSIIDAAVFSGDFVSWDFAQDESAPLLEAIKEIHQPIDITMGNHDAGFSSRLSLSGTNSQVYNKMFLPLKEKLYSRTTDFVVTQDTLPIEGKTYYSDSTGTIPCEWAEGVYENSIYYFHDYTDKKIRLISLYDYDDANDTVWGMRVVSRLVTDSILGDTIVLDTLYETMYRIERGFHVYRKKQMDWFIETLQSVPEDWGVMVLKHEEPLDLDTLTIYDFAEPASPNFITPSHLYTRSTSLMLGHVVPSIVDAWIHHKPLSRSFGYKGDAAYMDSLMITADFSQRTAKSEFICYLCGHDHVDGVFRFKDFDGQLLVLVTTSRYTHGGRDILPRVLESKTEDAFNVLSVDRSKRKIYITRIGSNFTKTYVDRSCTIIPY